MARQRPPSARVIENRLRRLADAAQAAVLLRFFKTGKGEYGEGDRFLGIKVPVLRKLVKEYCSTPLEEVARLLQSPTHEARLVALLLLVQAYERGDDTVQRRVFKLYLDHTDRINNWDLVDLSAPQIVGAHLASRSRRRLETLARSKSLWERRIAIVATHHFIRHNEFDTTLRIAEILLHDEHDLIHKAVGWMLREVWKRDQPTLERFLKPRCREMPRTMLRYAIERFPEPKRQAYLKGTVR